MKTVKRYYQDVYVKEIETRTLEVREEEGHILVSFEETIFYPGGGGQLPDKGMVNDINVEKITIDESGIWHHLPKGAKIEKGSPIVLKINWPYRYYNMQQHSGQHLLSYVLHKRGLQTVSVHLGEAYTLIELEGEAPDNNLLHEIEKSCNRLINDALPVKTHWINSGELDKYPLRRAAGSWEKLRIVEIGGLDYAACGGTHVDNTAEIGLVKLIHIEKIRGRHRIKALIGEKAYEYFNQVHEIIEYLKSDLPSDLQNIVSRTRQLKEEFRDLKREKKRYQSLYIDDLCCSFPSQKKAVILHQLSAGSPDDLQMLASCLKKRNDVNVLIINENKFCFITTEENKDGTIRFLKNYRDFFAIKGGGPPGFIQGTMGNFDKNELSKALNNLTVETRKELETT